jgi:hypothetical protein
MILVVKAEDSQLSGCGFKPRRCIMDGVSKASCKLEKIEVAKWGTLKKGRSQQLAWVKSQIFLAMVGFESSGVLFVH